jgi:hypothetical protein
MHVRKCGLPQMLRQLPQPAALAEMSLNFRLNIPHLRLARSPLE